MGLLVLNGVVATNILAFCTFDIIFKIILKKTFFSRSHNRRSYGTAMYDVTMPKIHPNRRGLSLEFGRLERLLRFT